VKGLVLIPYGESSNSFPRSEDPQGPQGQDRTGHTASGRPWLDCREVRSVRLGVSFPGGLKNVEGNSMASEKEEVSFPTHVPPSVTPQ